MLNDLNQRPDSLPVRVAPGPKKHWPKMPHISEKTLLVGIIILILLAATGYFAYQYRQARNEAKHLSNPQVAAQQANDELVAAVGKLIALPEGETPTIATVTDASKLAGQNFFADAQNGDKVLIYTKAKKAYLYRPSTDKIINVAPVTIGNSSTTSSNNNSSSGGTNP